MSDSDHRLVEFRRLNVVGKAVFLAGSAFKTLGAMATFAVGTAGVVWREAERALRDELDDGIEDAKVIDEDLPWGLQ